MRSTIRELLQKATWTLLIVSVSLSATSQTCGDVASEHPPFHWIGSEPLVLLTEYNPWAMAVGSDTPTFALYTDGTAIYSEGNRRSGKYVVTHLSTSQISQLFAASHLNKATQLKDCYDLVDWTDQPTNVLTVKTSSGFKSIAAYGRVRENDPETQSAKLPADLRTAFDYLFDYHAEDAKPWQPTFFEVTIWPFTYAQSSIQWPTNFPNLTNSRTVKHKQSYHLFLPIAQLNQFEAFEAKIKPTQAVVISGKKWVTSARFPFPHEGNLSFTTSNATKP
jgi:hypothetical protein